nr:DNA-binding protein [Mesorhizobium sp.]
MANVVVWVKISREIPARASCFGHARRPRTHPTEEEVVHLVAHELTDLSAGLASVGNRKTPFPLPHGRGTRLITADRASIRAACRRGATSSMQYDHIDPIKFKTRNFR